MLISLVGQYAFIYRTVDWEDASKKAIERATQDDKGAAASASSRGGEAGRESDSRGLAAADSAAEMTGV